MQAKIRDNVICECGNMMRLRQKKQEGDLPNIDYLSCQNRDCEHFRIAYHLPAIELKTLIPNKPPKAKEMDDYAEEVAKELAYYKEAAAKTLVKSIKEADKILINKEGVK